MKYLKKAIINYQKAYFITLRRGKYCVVVSKNWLQIEGEPTQHELNKDRVIGRFDTEEEAVEHMAYAVNSYIDMIKCGPMG